MTALKQLLRLSKNFCDFPAFFLDPITGETQILAEDNPNVCGIWLVIDNDGAAYMADIISDSLYSVDLNNGNVSQIGPLNIV